MKKRLPLLTKKIFERLYNVLAYRSKEYIVYQEWVHAKYLLDHIPNEPQTGDDELIDLEIKVEDDRIECLRNFFPFSPARARLSQKKTQHNTQRTVLFFLLGGSQGAITTHQLQKVLPLLMQDASIKQWDSIALGVINEWYVLLAQFAMRQFDRSDQGYMNFRDFKTYARHDPTVQVSEKSL